MTRIDQIRQLISEKCQDQKAILDILQVQEVLNATQSEKLEEVSKHLVIQDRNSWDILSVAKDALSGIMEVKSLMIQLSQNVINLQIIASNPIFLRSLDPTKELPVVLEDALGRHLMIPPEWIDALDWEVRLSKPLLQ